jgi:hypothetical protein
VHRESWLTAPSQSFPLTITFFLEYAMSLTTWKEKFYPIPAHEVPACDAVAHSLKKWTGLRDANLAKHGLSSQGIYMYNENGTHEFSIDSSTCALCEHYIDDDNDCPNCPLAQTLGRRCDDAYGPYTHFVTFDGPGPMIAALRKTQRRITRQAKAKKAAKKKSVKKKSTKKKKRA